MTANDSPPDRSVTAPKFRRRAEARPDEILDAALALFSEGGFDATRMDDVARRAGLSKGTVYLYFPSKMALLEGLVRRAIVPVAETRFGELAGHRGDPRPAIRRTLTAVAERLSDPAIAAVPKIVLREAITAPEIARMYREEVLDRAIPVLTALIAGGVADGHLRPVDPEMTVRSVVGPLLAHILLAEVFDIRPEGGLEIDRLVRNHLEILFEGLSRDGDG